MGQCILLVEDHPDTANVFARMLRREGYAVTIASKVAEALDVLSRQPVDLLISDIQLPDGDGTQLLQAARQQNPRLVGIIVSGHEEEQYRNNARDAGFAEFFVKPIDYPAVRQVIRKLMEQ